MNRETLIDALEAGQTNILNARFAVMRFLPTSWQLTTHTRELLELVADLLPEETDEERLRERYEEYADRDPSMEDDDPDDLIGQTSGSSASTTDDYYGEGTGDLRETIIRFDPEGVAPSAMPERLHAHEEGASIDEIASLPERRVFGVGSEEDYERISEAAWGMANAFVGSSPRWTRTRCLPGVRI